MNNSDAGLKSALAAQANAGLEVEKIKPLVDGKVVSDMQLRAAQANYDAATAQVAQAKAALGSSKINAGFALIQAPMSLRVEMSSPSDEFLLSMVITC